MPRFNITEEEHNFLASLDCNRHPEKVEVKIASKFSIYAV